MLFGVIMVECTDEVDVVAANWKKKIMINVHSPKSVAWKVKIDCLTDEQEYESFVRVTFRCQNETLKFIHLIK